MHLLGNMLYLYTFGDNIENLMGHARYLGFYLFCGVLASLTHVFTSSALNADLLVPSIGASGQSQGFWAVIFCYSRGGACAYSSFASFEKCRRYWP